MPSEKELRARKMSSLAMAITYHGGFPRFAKKCGLTPRRLPNGFYDNIEVLAESLRTLSCELGQPGLMPTSTQLREKSLFSLMSAIERHGGFQEVAKASHLRMTHDKKPDGYYDDFENVARDVLDAIWQTGRFGQMPSTNDLNEIGRGGVVAGIIRHGGFFSVAIQLGLKPGRMPNGYWTDKTIKEHITTFVQEFGRSGVFPTGAELRSHDRADLDVAITRNGGAYKFASLLRLTVTKGRQEGWWAEPGSLEREVLAFIEKHGTAGQMPTQQDFVSHGRSDLNNALFRYGGGHSAFAQRCGLSLNQRPRGYWQDFNNLRNELIEVNKHFGYAGQMPSSPQLREAGFSHIDAAISSVWGGFFAVAERLGWSSVNMSLWPRSEIELRIAHELQAVIAFDLERHKVEVRQGRTSKTVDCDIVIPALQLIVEFDSWRWHSGVNPRGELRLEKDTEKSRLLRDAGWRVIRIREKPLAVTHEQDLSISGTSVKDICDLLIRRACVITSLSLTARKVSSYLKAPRPLRATASQQYIARVLARRRGDIPAPADGPGDAAEGSREGERPAEEASGGCGAR
jgi:very-short-patch-repair endonuclease